MIKNLANNYPQLVNYKKQFFAERNIRMFISKLEFFWRDNEENICTLLQIPKTLIIFLRTNDRTSPL